MANANINFNDGYKEYTINNDETKVIKFNPSDFNIIERVTQALKSIEKISEDMQGQDFELNQDGTASEVTSDIEIAGKIVSECDKAIKSQIDYILGSEVSKVVFGEQSCLASVGGKPMYEGFLDAVIPIIKKDVDAEQKASQKRVEKYTKVVKK